MKEDENMVPKLHQRSIEEAIKKFKKNESIVGVAAGGSYIS